MCGIAGIVAHEDITAKLVDSIRNLEYRGYDSCGVALMNGSGVISVSKNVGAVDEVSEKENFLKMSGNIGIAHTRWATHGNVTKANSHPHSSGNKAFTITHNGIVSNHDNLRTELGKKGYKFKSGTDTEVIVHLIDDQFKKLGSVESAFVNAMRKLEGTYAIAMITAHDKGKIYCSRMESPLLLGVGSDANYVGSDFNAFINYTKSAVFLEDGEYAIVTHENHVVKKIATGKTVERDVQELQWDLEMAQKGGFPHYMLKEIYEQPQIVHRALDIDGAEIREMAKAAINQKNFFITGVGTTFYVAQIGQYYFSNYAGITPMVISSDEFRFLAQVDSKSLVLAISQSGETYDTLSALRHAKARKAKTAAIINVMGSSMARMVDHLVLQGSGPEICVISTKAALAQMIVLARIALEAGVMRKHITAKEAKTKEKELRKLPNAIDKLLNEQSAFIHAIAKKQSNIRHWLFLGRGRYYPVARESALKMKEVSYVHAEGMPSGFLKHGTIALIDDDLNSVVFTPTEDEKDLFKLTLSSAEEIRARNGYVLGIRFKTKLKQKLPFSDEIVLPKTPSFIAPFLQVVVAHLLSYFTATTLKRNIDRPRALAKSVT
ncbi:MAG TPA: glutamine--fructose-6-phosphate transaminase (isomerizing), partial [Nitrospinota bacterium]|nr:glutamine--fructose-6-phosphate transaminase (isomerizing) [Nitrospinota bacterium]